MKIDIKLASVMLLVGALFVWSFYKLMYGLCTVALESFGIVGDVYQNLALVVITGSILILKKKSIKKALKLK